MKEGNKMITVDQMNAVIDAYMTKGIVTRNECSNMDSRPLAEEIYDKLKELGCKVSSVEANINNYADYTRAVYDPDKFDYKEAIEYLKKNVLK